MRLISRCLFQGSALYTLLIVVQYLSRGNLLISGESVASDVGTAMRYYNVGVLMASQLDSPFDLERCGPAIDLALEEINERFLRKHNVYLRKVQAR